MSFPPSYKEIAHAVSDYLAKGSEARGWQLDATEPAQPGQLNAFPYTNATGFGVHLVYDSLAYCTTIESKISPSFQSWRAYLPKVTYRTKVNNTLETVEVDAAAGTGQVMITNPIIHATGTTAVLDGCTTEANMTARMFDQVYAGVSVDYDPKRSGVRNFTAMAIRYGCPHFHCGDLLAQYSLRDGLGLHLRVPLHRLMDAAIVAERRRFIAGVQARSPCGARLMINANVTEGTYTMTAIRNMNDIWKVTLTCTAPFVSGDSAPKIRGGFKLTHMNEVD